MTDPHLAQQALWDAIHAGTGAQASASAAHFRGDARLDAAGRMNIYAEMYDARLLEALQNDFPWTAQLIGDTDDAFAQTVRAYVRAYPLRAFTLAGVGEKFPDFLVTLARRADLAEVARLEWLRGVVSIAEDTDPLPLTALSAHGEGVVGMHCTFAPSVRWMDATHDVCAVIDALASDRLPPSPHAAPNTLVAWRHDDQVYHTALTGPAADALHRALEGSDIATICDAFATCSEPAQAAFAALGAWFADGWVRALT